MKTLNKIQLIIILALISLGLYVFASPYFVRRPGVIVVSISNPECQNIHTGDVITEAGGNQIKGTQDFSSLRFQANQFVSLVVNSGPGGCVALSDGSLGIDAKESTAAGIIFGADLVGGVKYTVNTVGISTNQIQNISNALTVRTSYLNLPDTKIQNEGGSLKIIAGKSANVNQLLFRGYFEGNIQEGFVLQNNTANLLIGTENYTIERQGDSFLINNKSYVVNSSFYLKDVKATIVNTTNTSIIFSLTAFNNSDILGEVPGYSQVSFDSSAGTYSFNTLIRLSSDAGKRFKEITQNIKTIVIGSQINLDAALTFDLDGNELSRLGMPASIKGQDLSTIYVIVSDPTQQSLLNKKNLVEAAINSGSLPHALSVSNSEELIATQKNNILPSLVVIVFAVAVVPLVLGGKFKKFKHNSISILIGSSEIFSIISLFAAFQIFYRLNSAFDFPALVGLVLLSLNWVVNVISVNLTTHAQRELSIKIKYKKLISLSGLVKIFLVAAAVAFAVYGYGAASIIVFVGMFLDLLLFRPFYKNFVS